MPDHNEPPKGKLPDNVVRLDKLQPQVPMQIKSALTTTLGSYTPLRNIGKFKGSELVVRVPFGELKQALEKNDLDKVFSLCFSEKKDVDIETAKAKTLVCMIPVPLITEEEADILAKGGEPKICARLMQAFNENISAILLSKGGIALIDYSFVREFLSDETVQKLEKSDLQQMGEITREITGRIEQPSYFSFNIGEAPVYDFENVINFLGDENLSKLAENQPYAFPHLLDWIATMMAQHDELAEENAHGVDPTSKRIDKLLIIELLGREMFTKALFENAPGAMVNIDLIWSFYYPPEEIRALAKTIKDDPAVFLNSELKIRNGADPKWHPGFGKVQTREALLREQQETKARVENGTDELNALLKELGLEEHGIGGDTGSSGKKKE